MDDQFAKLQQIEEIKYRAFYKGIGKARKSIFKESKFSQDLLSRIALLMQSCRVELNVDLLLNSQCKREERHGRSICQTPPDRRDKV